MQNAKRAATKRFDERFDAGEDVSDQIDWSAGQRLHGGRRLGAGRKAGGRKPYTVRLHPEVHAKLQARADRQGVSISAYVEQLVES